MGKPVLQWLPGFMQAARSGNLTRAAEQLNLTVSALSHQMRKLEERLGRRLLQRGPRGIDLTDEGRDLYQRLEPHYQALETLLSPQRSDHDDRLGLTVLASMANAWLLPRLGRFVAAHPELQLQLDSSVRMVEFDKERQFDAGIRFGRGDWPGLHAELLFEETLSPAASPELIKRLGLPKPGQLHRYPLIDDPSGRWRRWFDHYGQPQPKRYVARFNETESAHRAAAEGLGVVLARHTLARPLIEAKRLRFLGRQTLPSEFSYWLVYPERSLRHRGLMRFREWLLAEARTYRESAATD